MRALASLLLAVSVAASPARGADETIWLELRTPESGDVVAGPVGVVEVAGWAGASSEDRHELIIAIDASGSTGLPSGVDVNGNGRIGRTLRSNRDPLRQPNPRRRCSDAGDTVLAAEIAGARHLIEHLDSKRTRVGIVIFSEAAQVIATLESSRAELGAALDEVASETFPSGKTDIADALRAATRAVLDGARLPGAEPERSLILLSDGTPEGREPVERSAVEILEAADGAAEMGVRIHSFAIGVEIMQGTDVYSRISSRSGGHFVAVQKPADIGLRLSRLNLTKLAEVVVANASTGEPGRATRLFPDGSFDGVVGLVPGENRISVTARGPAGARQVAERVVVFEKREPRDAAEALAAREKLARLRERTMETELTLEIERSRAEQEKRLDLLLDPGSG
jgi:Mg-chelatase subunit ChlD